MCRGRIALGVVLAVALLPAACGGDEPGGPTPLTSVPGGLTTYDVDPGGFSITLPTSWIATSGGESFDQDAFDELARENPELGLDSIDVEEFAFVAFAPHLRHGVGANVNVMVSAVPSGARIEEEVRRALAEIESLPGVRKPVEHEFVSLPAGKALRLSYSTTSVATGGDQHFAVVQYAVLAEGSGYLLTFTTHPAELERSERLVEFMAGSLQPTGKTTSR